MTTRVFVVDDHEVIRRGIAALVNAESDLELIGEASTVAESLALVPQANPDVAVLDVRLPDGNGVELCRELQSRRPGLRCLMLTSFDDHDALMDAIIAGAAGFVLKGVVSEELVNAIRTAGSGESLLSAKKTEAMLAWLRREQEQADPLRELTAREREVLELIGEGLTNREISQRMFLAEKTVKNYVSQMLSKLAMRHRSEAAVLATELRLDKDSRKH
ncbi:LuxR family two component transcriptional regulator [Saccharopolyspora erythraea NRRL 2338]|uniref:Response regulator, two-component system n=2 Tax=Saccharopolyspora erythraea TaxID=1836 RepID=A4FFD8_SACEN|nr:response regulator transcription factor [Saccharopolyspora erythraea]EQD81938.1 LuxR family transcriptional regulator [Saccharopolyspora erythraea D]PFG96484.1 LuxR family two component transcriptional regulator [Saccharopolyspora erythraea NRRL 2338]QRK92979.1 response regulator transcription factor [Saccharopolyspora erythraea]CAM02763.1 response regulator, two-component system [Saccharopolyspora erythraea NRRL 2338]